MPRCVAGAALSSAAPRSKLHAVVFKGERGCLFKPLSCRGDRSARWRPEYKGLRGVGRVKSGSDGARAAPPSLMSSRREAFRQGLGRAALGGFSHGNSPVLRKGKVEDARGELRILQREHSSVAGKGLWLGRGWGVKFFLETAWCTEGKGQDAGLCCDEDVVKTHATHSSLIKLSKG